MAKDTRLINIYLKIYHKKVLTMDDLGYLAKYDPECFEKTCKNVVYNVPKVKPIMEPEKGKAVKSEPVPARSEWQTIEKVLYNLKRLEANDYPVADIDADQVKNLLGNLYMELLFPHNDQYAFVDAGEYGEPSVFDKRA